MSGTDIVLERDTANDEFASVVTIYVQSGKSVQKDELIFDIENSKATQELRAPSAGILKHDLAVGASVDFGVPIARIVWPGDPKGLDGPLAARDAVQEATTPVAAPSNPDAKSPADVDAPEVRIGAAEPSAPAPSDIHPQPSSEKAKALSRDRTEPLPAPANGPSGASSGAIVQPAGHPPASRFSIAALSAIAEARLEAADFDQPFVTLSDVRARERQQRGPRAAALPIVPNPMSPVPAGQAVAGRKQAEIEVLTKGAGNTMLSVLGVNLGALVIPREPDSLFLDRITDLVIYEASRLMRKFPRLNAAYNDGRVVLHEAINAGLAIDQGGRLVVYGISHSDRVSLSDLSEVVNGAIERYVDQTLTGSEMSRATFTVTDLSGSELDFIFPLLPRGQSCIIGITRSEQNGFRLFAGFDHRVTEGRDVGMFLDELRERLLSFGASPTVVSVAARCVYCERSADDAVSRHREKGLLKIVDRHGRDALCCASCWNGW